MRVEPAAVLASVVIVLVVFFYGGRADAVIGGASSRHNMTEVPNYGFGGSVCAACHKPHASPAKMLWTNDKEAPADKNRNIGPAKAASRDQAAGGNDYPGIYLCLDCHSNSASAPSWAKKPGHTAANVMTHSTREMQAAGYTTKYTAFVQQCTDCHDPHQHWDGSFSAGENGYMIKPRIKTPLKGEKTVSFTTLSGPGSLGTNGAPYRSLCEACHTKTSFHRYSGYASHHDGANCTQCHSHSQGFAGIISASCSTCHGYPPAGYSTLVGRSANPGQPPTGATTAGKHAYHAHSTASGSGYACRLCHSKGMGDGKNQDKLIDVRFSVFGVSTSGSFDGFTPISGYAFSPGNTTGGTLGCRNTYCHGNFKGGIKTNTPVWNNPSTGACGTCHPVSAPALENHEVHLSIIWGPKAACDDCHPANSMTGRHAGHVDGQVSFKDGKPLSTTDVCNGCHGCTAATKPVWGNDSTYRGKTTWCERCHNGSSTINTAAGTGGVSVTAPNVVGDGVTRGYDVTGHGKTGINKSCADCHAWDTAHIDGVSPTYKASQNNYKTGYRLKMSNTVPLLGDYSSSMIGLCYYCHVESKVVGMPPEGKNSAFHVHAAPISVAQWSTNYRNMSTVAGERAGNYDVISGGVDVPTNIHWNHLDDYGSSRRGSYIGKKLFDSDSDGTGDSYVVCETCHNPHGTRQPAMVLDTFSVQTNTFPNRTTNPTYRWLGSSAYSAARCNNYQCHSQGDAPGTAGTRWYREPISLGGSGVPLGLKAVPLP